MSEANTLFLRKVHIVQMSNDKARSAYIPFAQGAMSYFNNR
ncbi:hypothetical protein [Pseudoalteromonas holothuriae]|uniref:Uncharacterized protein n=1 Tax=Pseudoalteromonas holothuriae TaxID=2963714 RepID=A0A9W4W7P2_9GAMM|nr:MULTISPECIES: hypothetical protein [unclassified Pseudoalteromonas]CAH9066744.1 hypothetical protein PSECIP111854_03951 [Pseudoalteromonas sp. CIP111854]